MSKTRSIENVDPIPSSQRAARVEYAIRDVVIPATALEAEGHDIIKLNIGDPLAYPGLPTPTHMIDAYVRALRDQHNGYSPSYGIPDLRAAIALDECGKPRGGWTCQPEDVYVCHGVTEALQVLFAATLEQGDEVLAPGPHYPPYLAYPQMFGAHTVEYRLDPNDGWRLDLEDISAKMNDRTRLLVLIDPNNPTGNVCEPHEIDAVLEIARKWPNCIVVADEIYDRMDFTGHKVSIASRSTDVPVITLNGVAKVYYAPGWRIGYMALHDPSNRLDSVRDGIERLLRSRLCASTPAQHGYLAGLTGDKEWMNEYNAKVLARRDLCIQRINAIEGIEVEAPGGAFYMFARLTHPRWTDRDKDFVLDLLHAEHVLLVHGSGFSKEYGIGHVRIVYLGDLEILDEAFVRIERFLTS